MSEPNGNAHRRTVNKISFWWAGKYFVGTRYSNVVSILRVLTTHQNRSARTATAGRDSVMVCLLTDDVDSCFRHITMQGHCTVEQAPKRIERFGIYNALVRDPDGYLVEIQRFLNPGEQAEFSS